MCPRPDRPAEEPRKEDADSAFAPNGIRRRADAPAPAMIGSIHLLGTRRFLPLFTTQLLGAFNDNLFKNAMVLFVVYRVYNDEQSETWFSAITTGVFILPFFLLSALSGQLADARDKARMIRIIKFCEILIMLVGAAGLGRQGALVGVRDRRLRSGCPGSPASRDAVRPLDRHDHLRVRAGRFADDRRRFGHDRRHV